MPIELPAHIDQYGARKKIARLKRLLAEFEAIPPQRREDELADIRADSVRAMLAELERKPRRV